MGLFKLVKLFAWFKANSYDKLVDFIAKYLLENKYSGPFIARHKRAVGFFLTLIGLALVEAPKFYPGAQWIGIVSPLYLIFSGVILQGLGYIHAASKKRRNVEYPIVQLPWRKGT